MAEKNVPEIRFAGFDGDWERRKLGNVSDIIGGGTPSTSIEEYWGGDVDWYAPAEINGQIFVSNSQKKITELGLQKSSATVLPVGTVLFTSRAGIGKVAILAKIGATNQGFQSIIPHENELNSYFIFSRAHELKCYAETVGAGSTFVEVSGKQMAEMPILIPLIDEQTAIGSFFRNLDNLITLHQRKYDKLVIVKKSMLEKMFPKDGADVPEIRFTEFSGAWERRKIGDITTVASAARVHKEEWTKSGVPFFRSSDVVSTFKGTTNEKAFISHELFTELSRLSGKPEKDDILVTGGGSIGIPYLVPNDEPLYSKDADLIWIKSSEEFDSQYLFTYFATPQFRKYVSSISHIGTIAHYTIEQVKETSVFLPPVEEQAAIGTFFCDLDNLITLHRQELEKLKNIKKSMLDKMFV